MIKQHKAMRQASPISRTRALTLALILGLAVSNMGRAQTQPAIATTPASAGVQLPLLGDGSEMSSNDERRLGDRIARELYRDPDYLDDPVLAEYLQGIWQPLLAAAKARGDLSPELGERFAWEILLGRDRTVNAFALPGGYLGVNLGLIAVVSSRDELASVLGHELSHVTQRHISRLMSRQSQQAPWMLGAMILGVLAASKSPDAGNALIVGGQAVAAQNQLNFSRDMEREADRIGFGVMTQAGFEAQGFVTMFDKLQQASRLNDNGAYPYLRSHPLTTERIADMQARQSQMPPAVHNGTLTAEHAIIAVRAKILSNPGVDALRSLVQEADGAKLSVMPAARQIGVLYGSALAASRLRDFVQALALLDRLKWQAAADIKAVRLYRLLKTEVALAAGDSALALASLSTAGGSGAAVEPLARPELLLWAQLAQPAEVAQRLQLWVAAHPRDAAAWQQLSTVYAAQGQTVRAISADAEARVALLDYPAALDRFKAAQELYRKVPSGNAAAAHVDASIIDARKRQVEVLLKEQSVER